MNIVFVNSTHKWGGIKTWCVDMAESLMQQGENTFVIGRPGPFVDKCAGLGIHTTAHEFGADFSPLSIAFFLRFFIRNKADVVITNVSKDLRTAGVAAKLLGIPLVQHIGAQGDVVDRPKTRFTQHFFKPHILTCSEFITENLIKDVPVFGGYDVQAIFPGTRPAAEPPSSCGSPRTIIATSQLNVDKGHPDLLHALAALKKRGYDFKCIIVGTGLDAEKLQVLGRELDLDSDIEWTGFVTDVQAQLRRADIFMLPTYSEPLGIALEEAMAQGLVPIARDAGGPPEIWHPEMREYLVNCDPKVGAAEFEKALASLLDKTDEELVAMKRETYDHAVRTFALDKQAREFLAWMKRFV